METAGRHIAQLSDPSVVTYRYHSTDYRAVGSMMDMAKLYQTIRVSLTDKIEGDRLSQIRATMRRENVYIKPVPEAANTYEVYRYP